VRTRLTLDKDFRDQLAQGFALITAGFGSFAIFDGLSGGEHDTLPKAFALAATAIGVIIIALDVAHYRRMTRLVDLDEFGAGPVPELPDEQRPLWLAVAAMIIGVISFVALLFTT
jgi:hypothetical protein